MTQISLTAFRPALGPAAILAAATILVAAGARLPASLAGLSTLGPYLVLVLAAAVCLWFNRGRAFIALASLLAAYAGYRYALDLGAESFAARAVYASIVVLVPLNVLVALLLPERGVFHHHDYRWLFLGVTELVLVAWVAASGQSSLSGAAWQGLFDHWPRARRPPRGPGASSSSPPSRRPPGALGRATRRSRSARRARSPLSSSPASGPRARACSPSSCRRRA